VASFGDQVFAALAGRELLEQLAAVEHERWSHWQRYLHSKCVPGDDGSLTIPAELVARWSTQMTTPYAELSEAEKETDRQQVRTALEVIRSDLESTDVGHRPEPFGDAGADPRPQHRPQRSGFSSLSLVLLASPSYVGLSG